MTRPDFETANERALARAKDLKAALVAAKGANRAAIEMLLEHTERIAELEAENKRLRKQVEKLKEYKWKYEGCAK